MYIKKSVSVFTLFKVLMFNHGTLAFMSFIIIVRVRVRVTDLFLLISTRRLSGTVVCSSHFINRGLYDAFLLSSSPNFYQT